MPPDPPSNSASGAQQDLGLNEHPYLTLTYAPDISASAVFFCLIWLVIVDWYVSIRILLVRSVRVLIVSTRRGVISR